MGVLTGRVAIVTGAASGIGRAVAERYCAEGAGVIAADINAAGLERLVAEVEGAGHTLVAVPCDVSDERQIERVVQTGLERFGKIDILANIAQGGLQDPRFLIDTTRQKALDSFITGPLQSMLFMQHCLPSMRARHYGRIINVASPAAVAGSPGHASYVMAKGAVQALTRSASQEWGAYGITTNCVLPIAQSAFYDETARRRLAEQIPVKRFGTPKDDCAPAFVFLASEDAGYVNGQMIGVDGGYRLFA